MKRLPVVVVTLSLLGSGAATAMADGNLELSASLNGGKNFPHAQGQSRVERQDGNRDFNVSLSGAMRLSGHRLVVHVAGNRIGTMLVSSDGMAQRDWNSADGHSVPSVMAGNGIRITTLKGTLVASGTFHQRSGD